MAPDVLTPLQFDLAVAHARVGDLDMGVLGDGTPYLTGEGLARACGQPASAVRRVTEECPAGARRPGWSRMWALAEGYGHRGDALYRDIAVAGEPARVYPDGVCMAILEYFAFESCAHSAHVAQRSYRLLARHSLRHFIYTRVGYRAADRVSDSWRYLHDRVALNPLPPDYFSVFREITHLLIAAIQAGLPVGPRTVPDISVGMRWGRYWTEGELHRCYGRRCKHLHRFPAPAAPDRVPRPLEVRAWIYPITAVGEFRAWMNREYLPVSLAAYLRAKTRVGALSPAGADHLLAAVNDNRPAEPAR